MENNVSKLLEIINEIGTLTEKTTIIDSESIDELKVTIAFVAIIFAIIQIVLNYKHNKNTYELNKRNNSVNYIKDSVSGTIRDIRDELKSALIELDLENALWENDKNINTVLDMKDEQDDTKLKSIDIVLLKTYDLLNFYESIANAINVHMLDEDIIHNYYALIFIDFRRWTKPLIVKNNNGLMPWSQFADIADKWEKDFKENIVEFENEVNFLEKSKLKKVHKDVNKI